MKEEKLDKWAECLLDTGKRNNLINFKDTKGGTLEIICPSIGEVFDKINSVSHLEVFDTAMDDLEQEQSQDLIQVDRAVDRDYLVQKYGKKLKKNQVLLYNAYAKTTNVLKKIEKTAKSALEETGVNIAHLAIGFIKWKESNESGIWYHAPILLIPVSIYRESAIHPYKISALDDEVIVNSTFNYKLQNEFDIRLPEFGEDDTLQSYLDKVESIVSKMQWEVKYECKLGTFSFQKNNMYRDVLDNKSKIMANKNVKALMGEYIHPDKDFVENEEGISSRKSDIYMHNVVDADSSQLDAITYAKQGKSFVLQGPPGTGKSQTITNIIAECINDGKSVLFVSEKLAALEVVFNKLKNVGLDEFCLPLHSHKANKKDVIEELCRTINAHKCTLKSGAEYEIEKKKKNQVRLDHYVSELHKKQSAINMSLYEIYSEISKCTNAVDIRLCIKNISNKGEQYIKTFVDLVEKYIALIDTIGYDYRHNCWYGFVGKDTSYQAKYEIEQYLQEFAQYLANIMTAVQDINHTLTIKVDSLADYDAFVEILTALKSCVYANTQILQSRKVEEILQALHAIAKVKKDYEEQKAYIDKHYNDWIYEIDSKYFDKRFWLQYGSVFSRAFNKEYSMAKNQFKQSFKKGHRANYYNICAAAKKMSSYNEILHSYESQKVKMTEIFGEQFDVQMLDDYIKEVGNLATLRTSNTDYFDTIVNKNLLSDSRVSEFLMRASRDTEEYESSKEYIVGHFDSKKCNIKTIDIQLLQAKINECIESLGDLDNWLVCSQTIEDLATNGMLEYLDKMLDENIARTSFLHTFGKAYYTQWADYVLHANPLLMELSRVYHDKVVADFAQNDRIQFEINKSEIRANLCKKRPSSNISVQGSPAAILLREGEKKRKQMNIRTLFSKLGSFIQLLKPCLLMSPLSVSTYLNPDDISFDLVIFDEASQIFPQDAIGAIYRAKQLIVVGDSKQMPPSNFFANNYESSEDEEEDITDFESILDLCAANFPQISLRWHYRSKYEQLIAFSNKNFYRNNLVTFPSAKTDKEGVGVDYCYVDGVFDRQNKTNRREAERIADMVIEHYSQRPDKSLGVVAFSISQQDLIERLVEKKRALYPELDPLFDKGTEPFFVKNLETVQGDERDVIIFSVAYCRDSSGKFYHNFGPLSRVGGERRLNVAVTRAKYNVKLVTSLHYTDIDMSKVNLDGARLLREYLDFAENGEIALERNINVSAEDSFDSPFEMEVCEFLRDNGYIVDTQVGCSDFRIDLGVKRAVGSDYVLAIECDGASYHSSRNARDRDRLRQEILEQMGWKFYRVWSTDWFRNNEAEKKRLLSACEDALAHCTRDNLLGGQSVAKPDVSESQIFEEQMPDEIQDIECKFDKYAKVDICQVFKNAKYNRANAVFAIIEQEAPISEEWLLKRLCRSYYKREKVIDSVRKDFSKDIAIIKQGTDKVVSKNGFYYIRGQKIPFRKSNNSEERKMEYVAKEELANGMYKVLRTIMFSDKEGLYRTMAHLLGYAKTSKNMQEYLDSALALLGDKVIVKDNQVKLNQ